MNFKKFLDKPQSFIIPRNQVAEVEFKVRELPIKLVGPGFTFNGDQT